MNLTKLNKSIAHIKTKEDFFKSTAAEACWYAYTMFKEKKWDKAHFDERLREWWRVNHNDQNNILNDVKEIFG